MFSIGQWKQNPAKHQRNDSDTSVSSSEAQGLLLLLVHVKLFSSKFL